jgi:hypothetical protein
VAVSGRGQRFLQTLGGAGVDRLRRQHGGGYRYWRRRGLRGKQIECSLKERVHDGSLVASR